MLLQTSVVDESRDAETMILTLLVLYIVITAYIQH